jgi:hypothetical protein
MLVSCVLIAYGAEQTPSKPANKPANNPTGKAANKVAAPDLEFLEYLGTLEGDEDNWTDVANLESLAQTNSTPAQSKDAQSDVKGKSKTETAAKGAGNEK